ncbi:MAG: phage holin family protein [Bacteroidota bacterium]
MFNLDGLKGQFFRFLGIDSLLDNLSDYLEARIAQVRQEIRNEIAKQLARVVMVLILVVLGLLTLAFISIAAGLVLNHWLGNNYAGFLIVAGCYLLITLIWWFGRHGISTNVEAIIREKMEKKS